MTTAHDSLVTIDEAAEELGLCPSSIRRWLVKGKLQRMGTQHQPMGRPKVLIAMEELREYLATPRNGRKPAT
jgi:predicted ArsR family transcriptional regulator